MDVNNHLIPVAAILTKEFAKDLNSKYISQIRKSFEPYKDWNFNPCFDGKCANTAVAISVFVSCKEYALRPDYENQIVTFSKKKWEDETYTFANGRTMTRGDLLIKFTEKTLDWDPFL